jgi:hypothetical protein
MAQYMPSVVHIKYNSKRRGFFPVQGSTVHHFTHYCGWARARFFFFNLVHNFFSGELVLIENQLILISYERVELKEEKPK